MGSLYDRMQKRVVHIQIEPTDGEVLYQSGIIVECQSNFAYIIADPRQLMDKIGVNPITIIFPDCQKLYPSPDHFLIRNGVVGILCYGSFNTDLVKKIEIHNSTLLMSQEVRVYEGVLKNITEGYVTLFSEDHFSHDCAVPYLAEYGAPVVTTNGELVGMCDSGEYHLDAKKILPLLDTIWSIRSDLGIKTSTFV